MNINTSAIPLNKIDACEIIVESEHHNIVSEDRDWICRALEEIKAPHNGVTIKEKVSRQVQ